MDWAVALKASVLGAGVSGKEKNTVSSKGELFLQSLKVNLPYSGDAI